MKVVSPAKIVGLLLFGCRAAVAQLQATDASTSHRRRLALEVSMKGDNGIPANAFPLGNCQGDCDSSTDCAGDLICYQRDSGDPVPPGCKGTPFESKDYCYDPNDAATNLVLAGDNGDPANAFPLNQCQGDCDTNSDCAVGLVCYQRNTGQDVPGCSGTPEGSKDYCIRQKDLPAPTPPVPAPTPGEAESFTTAGGTPAGEVKSFTTAGGIDYYHCVGQATTTTSHHIFLLHGASFDREVWMDRTGILEAFCNVPGLRVSSLDLPVSTNYEGLQTVIDDVAAQQRQDASSSSTMITTKPVVLVTPSASGYSVVSWMVAGDDDDDPTEWNDIPRYIETWVPVAPVALSLASNAQVAGSLGDVPVLAIYGDEDGGGERLSERLEDVVGATVVELSGGHPVYLDSEDDFVQNILDFLGKKM